MYGYEVGHLYGPEGIAVDSSNNVYVVDTGHNYVQKFDSNGKFISTFGSNDTTAGKLDVAVNSKTGNVYVVDTDNHRVLKFDSNGKLITKWGSKGIGDGQFENPTAIAVDSNTGNIYVVDTSNGSVFNSDRIQKFDSSGQFITKWGSYGQADGQFINSSGIAINPSLGSVYVADTDNDRIQVFAPSNNTSR